MREYRLRNISLKDGETLRRATIIFAVVFCLAIITIVSMPAARDNSDSPQEIEKNEAPIVTQTHSIKPSAKGSYEVLNVVDGDTLDVSIDGEKTRIRLIGVNTPETVHPDKPVECFGVEASNYTKRMLSGEYVDIELDSSQGKYDVYGRLLAYVYVDGVNFNKKLIMDGYAYEYTYNIPYKYQKEFKEAQKYADQNNKGLWAPGACSGK